MKIFDYLFYKVYKLINYFGNTDFYPEYNTWIISSTLLWLNMLTILGIVELKLEKTLTDEVYVIPFFVLYLVFTYIYFFRKERYRKIIETFDKQSDSKRVWGTIAVAVYILATLVLHFYFSERRRAMALVPAVSSVL